MDQSEKRRKELLESTRAFHRDRYNTPAVHPRYGNLYGELYGEEEQPAGSLGVRLILCCVIFVVYVVMDYQGLQIADVSSQMITQAIETDLGLAEVWNNL